MIQYCAGQWARCRSGTVFSCLAAVKNPFQNKGAIVLLIVRRVHQRNGALLGLLFSKWTASFLFFNSAT